MDKLEGYVEKITYRNEDNFYTVLTLSGEDGETCVVGLFPSISPGEYIEAEGSFTVHPAYGPQFKMERYVFVAPKDRIAILRYLSSGAVKGIGEKLAKRIVALFGDDTFSVLETEPERLAEVKGISERTAMAIAETFSEKRESRNAVLYLQQYGISLANAAKIYKQYGEDLYRVLRENPYRLCQDVSGIGFRAADEIALKMNVARDSDFRIGAAVIYVLNEAAAKGHTFLPRDRVFAETEALLGLTLSDFDHLLEGLLVDRLISMERDGSELRVYLRSMYRLENDTALMLRDLNIRDDRGDQDRLLGKITAYEKDMGVSLDALQREAILRADRNGVSILTGGPGTGKTTAINVMIRYFLEKGLNLMLAAPTGRAAKRMTEATGYEAQTLHRMLEVSGNPEDKDSRLVFNRNDQNPLEADVIIVDEMSMVDISLMHSLLKAMVPGMRLVLVGDEDQLPSVGPGEVLRDLIRSDCFPVTRLTKIFRQAEESDIIVNAHKINAGEVPEPKASKDFLFILREDPGQAMGATVTLLRDKLPKYVGASTDMLQVLTPMRKGAFGVENLNRVLQETFNPPSPEKAEKKYGDSVFRVGDKVMQKKNNYYLEWQTETGYPRRKGMGIFNGDMGIVRAVNGFTQTLRIEFDDNRFVEYPFASLEDLELGYAITVHKSQGSEYPAVVIPLMGGPEMLLNRNLLYTGVTRARKCVCIVGRFDTFAQMVKNAGVSNRFTGLREKIRSFHESY